MLASGHASMGHLGPQPPPRPLAEIEADIRALETESMEMLPEVTGNRGAKHFRIALHLGDKREATE